MSSEDANRKSRRARVSLEDVARRARLSKTAVSYALNGTGRLDERTRQRVLEIAQQVGYRANANARHLRRNTSGVLAITASLPPGMASALPNMDYFMSIWQAAVAAALRRGYMLLLVPFGTEPGALADMVVDGVIVIDPVANDPVVRYFEAHSAPVVTIGRDLTRAPDRYWWVDNDHAALTRAVLDHFWERGARRIGLILAAPKYGYSDAARTAYLDWAKDHDMALMVATVEDAPTESAAYSKAMEMLQSACPPQAIFTSLDRFAVGTLFAAASQGVQVPRELMIAAGNDGVVTRTAHVPITALDLRPDELGRIAVEMLLDRIEGKKEPQSALVPGDVCRRASTGGPSDRG